jgi:hypothetical protein
MDTTNCKTCNKPYSPSCDYRQGRCPHHPPLINIQPKDTSRGHFYVSLTKSFIRIVAGVCLVIGFPVWCGIGIVVAEVLGILEELV